MLEGDARLTASSEDWFRGDMQIVAGPSGGMWLI